ncbi:transposase IS66 [Parafrankia sp. EAN1pec]|uniref:IS66 family transposase n=1 Tax=Parafrankia sp. (strain EAN1pec) TaxID=298653 RepID=UPI00015DA150|nr:transposase IS66 [Frankia sp. EAN1pec]
MGVAVEGDGVTLAGVLAENAWLRGQLAERDAEIAALRARDAERETELEALRAELVVLRKVVFGRSSERGAGPAPAPAGRDGTDGGQLAGGREAAGREAPRRGPGARAGRRDYGGLPRRDLDCDFPSGGYACLECGTLFTPLGEHRVEQVDWRVLVELLVSHRRRYRRGCGCGGPVTVTAPGPSKAVGRGLFTNRFLAMLLVERYVAGRSQNSLVTGLARHGAQISPATLTGACAQVAGLLAPLAEKIVARSRGSWHLHADETTRRVFTPDSAGGPARRWLWVFLGPDSVCFVMDPSRSAAVLAGHAGISEATGQLDGDDGAGGPRQLVISSDFYAVYACAGRKADGIVNLFCWAHVRRYFIRAGDANPAQLGIWARHWREQFGALYQAHAELADAWQTAASAPSPAAERRLAAAHATWDAAIGAIDTARREQTASPGLQEPAKKALATMDREWDGLIAHRDYPMIGLDNNPAERMIRKPVITRRNTGGSRTDDAACRHAHTQLPTTYVKSEEKVFGSPSGRASSSQGRPGR